VKLFASIGAKIITMIVVSVFVAVGLGLVGLNAIENLRGGLDNSLTAQQALHNQSEIDGANHAVQYDVLVLATGTADQRQGALADLADRRETLTEGIEGNRDLLLPLGNAELRRAFTEVVEPLRAYDAAAGAAADEATAGQTVTPEQVAAVDAAQVQFDLKFDALTEAINAHIGGVATAAKLGGQRANRNLLLLLVIAALFVPAFGVLIWRAVNRTLDQTNQIVAVVDAATAGDLTGRVTVTGTDAIGQVGSGLARLLSDLRGSVGGIGQTANRLSHSADGLLSLSASMDSDARTASEQADTASTTARQVSEHVEAVARGTQEIGTAIAHIASSAATAAEVAAKAVRVAGETNIIVTQLDESSGKVTDVVRVISGIAEQTNLLALNATIEAARAGEAGKGFAIVASEVKDLAQETANATADIARRIGTIQADARGAVSALQEIRSIIEQIDEIQGTIAAEVEVQTANSTTIGRSIAEVARSSTAIADGIGAVADASGRTSDGAAGTRQAAQGLAHLATELQRLVGGFRY
jgi:methyl-accepting chemotaxis protein